MATATTPVGDVPATPEMDSGRLLVFAPGLAPADLEPFVSRLDSALPAESLLLAAPGPLPTAENSAIRLVEAQPSLQQRLLTAAELANAYDLAHKHHARGILVLGPQAESLSVNGVRDLANAITTAPFDLAVACYELPPRSALINSSILYPLSRALFASRIRYPLAVDLALSMRFAEKLSVNAHRFGNGSQGDAPLWSTSEAIVSGMSIEEIPVGRREFAQTAEPDLNNVLPYVVGSLFSDVESKAAYWQRARVTSSNRRPYRTIPATPEDDSAEVAALLQRFRLAYGNLQEIWSLVLPPNSLLGLKRAAQVDGTSFRLPDALWVRIVYDFLIAYRMRTINRSHVLGALIPLYLAWVASHINIVASGTDPEQHIEAIATAFEADKSYLVARWRWPDRFNP